MASALEKGGGKGLGSCFRKKFLMKFRRKLEDISVIVIAIAIDSIIANDNIVVVNIEMIPLNNLADRDCVTRFCEFSPLKQKN